MTELVEFHNIHSDLAPIATIDEFPSAASLDQPLLYPGIRPDTSFLVDGTDVFALSSERNNQGKLDFSITSNDSTQNLDEYLEKAGADKMEDRIPILGYGANMCPSSISAKFTKIGRPEAAIVPTIYGRLDEYDVVWSGHPGLNGNFIANLYRGEETQTTSVEVGVNFLTREQLLVMHQAESAYDLTRVAVEVNGVTIKALVYTGMDDILIKDGKPVAVEALNAQGRTLSSANTTELLDDLITQPVVQQVLRQHNISDVSSADSYVETLRPLKTVKGARKSIREDMRIVMKATGQSKEYALPVDDREKQSWANPSTIPTFGDQLKGVDHTDIYVLPSTEIPAWDDTVARDKVLGGVSIHLEKMIGNIERRDHKKQG